MATRPRKSHCRVCGRHRDEAGEMSATGRCQQCARAAVEENIAGIHFHTGPALLRWRRGVAAGVGGILLEDIPAYLDSLRETG